MKFSWGWKYFDWLIVFGGVVVAIGVWFIPSMTADPELQAYFKSQRELKAERLKVEAVEREIVQEREELGLVFVQPPPPKTKPEKPSK